MDDQQRTIRSPGETTGATDANDRVHHHARLDDGSIEADNSGPIITLCGLTLGGPRPGAAKLPCCPLCGLAMGNLGRACG